MDAVGTGPVLPPPGMPPTASTTSALPAPAPAAAAPPPGTGTAPTAPTLLPLTAQREQLRPPAPPVMTGEQMTALLRAVISGASAPS